MRTGMDNTNPEVREQEGNEKKHSQNSGTGRQWKKSIPEIREREGNEKNISRIQEREGNEKKIP